MRRESATVGTSCLFWPLQPPSAAVLSCYSMIHEGADLCAYFAMAFMMLSAAAAMAVDCAAIRAACIDQCQNRAGATGQLNPVTGTLARELGWIV